MQGLRRAPRRGRLDVSEGAVLLLGLVAAAHKRARTGSTTTGSSECEVVPTSNDHHARWSDARAHHPWFAAGTALLIVTVAVSGLGVLGQRLQHGHAPTRFAALGPVNAVLPRAAHREMLDEIWSDAPAAPVAVQPDRAAAVARSIRRPSRARVLADGVVWPVNGPITGAFGERRGGRRHPGVDISAPIGTEVRDAFAGRVTVAGSSSPTYSGYGLLVVVQHANGDQSLYAHLSRVLVHVGDTLTGGDVLGLVGQTGNATGPHLHFEIRRGGSVLDPVAWISSLRAAT